MANTVWAYLYYCLGMVKFYQSAIDTQEMRGIQCIYIIYIDNNDNNSNSIYITMRTHFIIAIIIIIIIMCIISIKDAKHRWTISSVHEFIVCPHARAQVTPHVIYGR